tara:strand:- start:234 stop:425 length:192 start_codon:yes stop_codon:yes gene_type:complete
MTNSVRKHIETIAIKDPEAIRIVIEEAYSRGITSRGGRQIAAAIIKEWHNRQAKKPTPITKEF